jgi:hypothetical protein
LVVRNPPHTAVHQIWHYQRDPYSPRDDTGRQRVVGFVPEQFRPDLRAIVRYIPEWVFVVCHPAQEGERLLAFSIFLEKARLSEPGWLVRRDPDRPDTIAYKALIDTFMSLVQADRREIPLSQDLPHYHHSLMVKVTARIDALQQCVDCQRRPHIAPAIWRLVRRMVQHHLRNLT